MRYLTDRKRAQGLGAAGSGTDHHWHMIVSSVLLVLVVPLFVFTFVAIYGSGHEEVTAFFARPVPAIITALTLYVAINHFRHEAQEAIEDYVHGSAAWLTRIAVGAFSWTLIAAGLIALVKLAL